MKKMKRLAALFLAVVMVMAMGMTTMAAGTCTLKIDAAAGHTYKVYQLLVGDLSSDGTKLSNIEAGLHAGEREASDIITAVTGKTGIELSNAAADLVKNVSTDIVITGAGVQTVTIDGETDIPTGYYVITDEYTNDPTGTETLSATMVRLTGNLTVEPKDSDVPEKPGKEVDPDYKTVSIGDEVPYTLTGEIPSMENFANYKYVLVDTLCKGLEPNVTEGQEIPVKLMNGETDSGKTVTFKVTKKETDTTTGKTEIRFALENAFSYKDCVGYTFSLPYTATVTKDADFEGNTVVELENKVKVEFSNDPDKVSTGEDFEDNEPKGETVEKTETVYSAKLVINKFKSSDGGATKEIFPNEAEFELAGTSKNVGYVTGQRYVEDAEGGWYGLLNESYTTNGPADDVEKEKYYKVNDNGDPVKYRLETVNEATYTVGQTTAKAFVNGEGVVSFTGLGAGRYTITEVTTPDGYNHIEPIEIEIIFNESSKTFSAYLYDENGYENATPINMGGYEIVNQAGALLPSTGGIGTTIFYVVGGILVVGAGVLLITKKRMSAREK